MDYGKLTEKKARLDGYRPLPPELVKNLEQWFIVELTYTSNAIEGNTLTRKETAVVVEKGLTVSGKSLVEHLEATNHAHALQKVLKLAERCREIRRLQGERYTLNEIRRKLSRILNILRNHDYQGVLIPDHAPQMACGAPWHAGMAFTMGYMKALLAETMED